MHGAAVSDLNQLKIADTCRTSLLLQASCKICVELHRVCVKHELGQCMRQSCLDSVAAAAVDPQLVAVGAESSDFGPPEDLDVP